MNSYVKYTLIFVALVLFQEFVFSNIELNTYMNPYVYVLFILILPFSINRSVLLLLSFLLGFSVDMLSGTLGLHTAACVVAGYVRPFVLSIFISRDDFEQQLAPSSAAYGLSWFIRYSAVMVGIHHFVLFSLEAFTFSGYFITVIRILLSTVLSVFFVVLSEYAFSKK